MFGIKICFCERARVESSRGSGNDEAFFSSPLTFLLGAVWVEHVFFKVTMFQIMQFLFCDS